jgi:hypothetical protein
MDDAGDVFGAIFSGGISVAVCQTVETVQSLIRTVQTVASSMDRMTREDIATAQRAVNNTANSVINNTNNAMRQFSSMVSDANRMVNDASQRARTPVTTLRATTSNIRTQLIPGLQHQGAPIQHHPSATSASPMADPHAIAGVMRQAADTMVRMQSDLTSHAVNHILSVARQAGNIAQRHVGAARRIAETSVTAPLGQLEAMLNDLVRRPERIFDPSSIVNESIERLTRAMMQVTEQINHEIMSEALASINDIDQEMRRVTGDLGMAQNIHRAMSLLAQRHDQQSLNALRSLIGGSHSALTSTSRSGGATRLLFTNNITQLIRNTHIPNTNINNLVSQLKSKSSALRDLHLQASSSRLKLWARAERPDGVGQDVAGQDTCAGAGYQTTS